jgi:DNA replication protein DnaC
MENLSKYFNMNKTYEQMTAKDFWLYTIDCYNDSEGNLHEEDGINCPVCKNKGTVQVVEGNYAPYRDCVCMGRRNALKQAKRSGLGKYLTKTINDYLADEEWRSKCKRAVESYLEKHSDDDVWFIACGQNGSGKTLLGSIIANTLLMKHGRAVKYVVWSDFIGEVKRDMMSENASEVSERMKDAKYADVLFLDEVFKEFNATDKRYLAEIINYRYTNDKKTILTSEKLLNELLDIDEATFGRAVEQCQGFIINIPRDRKKDWRLRSLKL